MHPSSDTKIRIHRRLPRPERVLSLLSISCASLEQRWKHLISRLSTGNEMGAEFNGTDSEVTSNSQAGLHYGIMRWDRRAMHRPICGRDKWEINGHWLRSDCYCQAPRSPARWGGFVRFSPINDPLQARTIFWGSFAIWTLTSFDPIERAGSLSDLAVYLYILVQLFELMWLT